MTLSDYNDFCKSLKASEHVVQWGASHVWKVGGKMFAVAGWSESDAVLAVTFKATEIGYEIMRDMPGIRPAPYLASRGMKWIQHYAAPGLDDAALREHIEASYHMAIERLTKKARIELGVA